VYHEQDYRRVDLTTEGEVPTRGKGESNFLKTLDHKLNVLYNQLKIAKYKTSEGELLSQDFTLTGKVQIHSMYQSLHILSQRSPQRG
jgi:hypothetical protein